MHAISGHLLFPYCFGFVKPNIIISQFLGELSADGAVITTTILKVMTLKKFCKYQWILFCSQVIEGIEFLHGLTILHNDIKADNVKYFIKIQLK